MTNNYLIEVIQKHSVDSEVVLTPKQIRNDLARFAGGWTQKDAKEFAASIAIFDVIDEDVWI